MNRLNRPYFKHFVVELTEQSDNLNSIDWLVQKIESLLADLKIKHIKSTYHKFSPTGISLVYILSSSHVAIHTWPENNYLHIDLVTCSQNKELENMEAVVKSTFMNQEVVIHHLDYYEEKQ